MTGAFYLVAALLLVALLGVGFMRASPAQLASSMRMAGPVVLGLVGIVALILGRASIGGMLISGAIAWLSWTQRSRAVRKSPGKRSSVRTAALEMELDHDSGNLEGVVLVGTYEGRVLGELERADLMKLYRELAGDGESRQLLEAYLDGRFPVWREDAQADGRDRERVPPGSGAMTKQEAYQVLGLESGASATDIRKAHRRLMQRLHPDIGGSSFLAARINEAKDILLSDHD
jgi:hypothetical protein